MSEQKHTPGPWEADRMLISPKAKDRRPGFVVNGPDRRNDLPIRICDLRVPAGLDGLAVGEANACLVAAAPDLLAACEEFVEHIESMPDDTEKVRHLKLALNCRAGDMIHAAIAKARGN